MLFKLHTYSPETNTHLLALLCKLMIILTLYTRMPFQAVDDCLTKMVAVYEPSCPYLYSFPYLHLYLSTRPVVSLLRNRSVQ